LYIVTTRAGEAGFSAVLRPSRDGRGLCQFEIKGLKGKALKLVWTSARPLQKQPIDSELASVIHDAAEEVSAAPGESAA
jgi:hypothetical protein